MAFTHKSLIPLGPILHPGWAFADQAAATTSPDLGGSILQLVAGLVVVIALLVATLWVLKRISAPRGEAAGLLRVVAGTAVGPRERVVIVEVGSTWMVLGVAPGQVNALAEIPKLAPTPQAPTAAESTMPAWLRRLIENRHAR